MATGGKYTVSELTQGFKREGFKRGFDSFTSSNYLQHREVGAVLAKPIACIDNPIIMVALNDAYAKLAALSEDRARCVVALIEDLAELQAREDAEDLAAARKSLADGEKPVPWEEAKARLDVIHGLD